MDPNPDSFKASKPIYSDSQGLMASKASQHNFSKVFKAGCFLAKKQQLVSGLFIKPNNDRLLYGQQDEEEEEVDNSLAWQLRKKYYSRKVKQISHKHQASSLAHYSKYVLNVAWSENYWSYFDFRAQKTHHIIKTSLALKSLGDLVILDQGIKLSQKDIFKMVRACDNKTSIRLDNCTTLTLEKLKKLPSYSRCFVKHLGLEPVASNDGVKPKCWLPGFDQLRSFSFTKSQMCPPAELFSEVLRIKSLKMLYLNLNYASFPELGLEELYTQIDEHNIYKWHIKVRTEFEDLIDEKYDTVLSKIDCLGLGKVQLKDSFGGPPDFTFRGKDVVPVRSTYGFYDLKYLHEKRKKVLELALIEQTRFDIGTFLNRCKSIQGLYIKSNDYEFSTWDGKNAEALHESINTSSGWTDNLRDVVLSFTQSSRSETAFDYLLAKIKTECPDLETLELFPSYNGNVNEYSDYDDSLLARNLAFYIKNADIRGLEKLISLQYLRLATTIGLGLVANIVNQLPNLKRLELTLGEGDFGLKVQPWDKDVAFNSLERLTEFKINKVWKEKEEWGEGILKNIHYLQGLQVLEFKDSTEDKMSLEMLKLLIEGFVLLKNLRRLVLNVHAAGVYTSNSNVRKGEKQREDEMLGDIKDLIIRYIESNTNLEELQISELYEFDIEKIKYIRYQ